MSFLKKLFGGSPPLATQPSQPKPADSDPAAEMRRRAQQFNAEIERQLKGSEGMVNTAREDTASPPQESIFRLDGCDLSPQRFRTHTVESVQKSLLTRLEDGKGSEISGSENYFAKWGKNGLFYFGFGTKSGLLTEVYVSAKYGTGFLGINTGEPERVFSQIGFSKFGQLKLWQQPTIVWGHCEVQQIYAVVKKTEAGRLIEVYLSWKQKPYSGADFE